MLMIVMILVLLFYVIIFFMFYKMEEKENILSPYECGFDMAVISRSFFSYRFFLISILFLIFDVEISLMLPIPYMTGELVSLWIFIIFIVVLILGILYEMKWGVLSWAI